MIPATASGLDRKIEWLPAVSTTVAPARSAIERCAGGGIIRSSVVTRYQLRLLRHAGSLIVPAKASTPHGTCESAMNSASSEGTSPANDAWNLSRSRNRKPSCGGRIGGTGAPGGRIGGTGAPGGGSAISVFTDSPASG